MRFQCIVHWAISPSRNLRTNPVSSRFTAIEIGPISTNAKSNFLKTGLAMFRDYQCSGTDDILARLVLISSRSIGVSSSHMIQVCHN